MPSTLPTSTIDDKPDVPAADPLSFDDKPKADQWGSNWLSDELFHDLDLKPLDKVYADDVEQPSFGQLMAGSVQQGESLASLTQILAEAAATSGHEYLLQPEVLDSIVEARMGMRGVRRSREMMEMADMNLWESIKHGVSNPLRVMLPMAAQSLRSQAGTIPVIAGAAAFGGPVGLAVSAGGSSALIEGAATFFDTFEQEMVERGMEVGSTAAWREALSDPAIYAAAKSKAIKSGVAVGVFDALSAGLLGKATSAASGPIKRAATAAAEATMIDAPFGAAGEATKQLLVEGRISSPSEIAAEMFAGLPMGGLQVAGGVLARRGAKPRAMTENEQNAASIVAKIVAARHASDMAVPPTEAEIAAQVDPITEITIDTLSKMGIEELAAAAVGEGLDVSPDVTEADKPALIAQILDEADKKLEMEADEIEASGTVAQPDDTEEATPPLSPSIPAPSEQAAPADNVGEAVASDAPPPIETEFPKKQLAEMIEEKWPGITGRIGQVDRDGMGDAAQRVEDTAAAQGDGHDQFIARVFKLDKEGKLGREDIGSLVGLNTDDLVQGDTFRIDGEEVAVTTADGQNVTLEIREPDTSLPLSDGEDMIDPGAVRTFTIARGQTIPANEASHSRTSQTRQPVVDTKSAETKAPKSVSEMSTRELHQTARNAGISDHEIRRRGDEWLRDKLGKFQESKPSGLDALADAMERKGRELLARTPGALPRGVRGSRSGSTTLHSQIAAAALLAGARAVRYGATSYKAVKQIVDRVVSEIGKQNRNLKNQTERITRDVMKLLKQSKGDDGKVDQAKLENAMATYSAKAQARDRKRTGIGMKEQVRNVTGAGQRGREPKTVTEPQALKARMKGQELAGRVSFAAGKAGEKMGAEVKKLDPKKIKVGFLKTFGGAWQSLFKDTKPHMIVRDIATFLKETHKDSQGNFVGAGPVSAETVELALRLDAKKYNALTEEEADDIRRMVRMFKAEHNLWNKMLGDEQARSAAQAADAVAKDVNKRPELDRSLGTAKRRSMVKAFIDYRATARTLASALGTVARRVFHDNFIKPQEKMFQRIMRVHDDMHKVFAEHGLTTKGERDAWIDDRRLKLEKFSLPDGRTISLTRSEVMSLYALNQRSNAEAVMTKNGVKSKRHKGDADNRFVIAAPQAVVERFQKDIDAAEARVKAAMGSPNPDDLKIAQAVRSAAEDRLAGAHERYVTDAIAAITGRLAPMEKDIVDAAVESIQTNITPDANAVSETLFGSPIFNESDYTMRMLIDRSGTWDNTDVRQILDLQTFFTAWIENAGFTKELQKHRNPVMLGDFFSEIDAQARDMSVYADLLAPIRDARMILTAKPVQQAIRSRFGTSTEQRLVRTLAKLTGMQRTPINALERITSFLSRNVASSLLGIKETVFLANRIGGSFLLQSYLTPEEMGYYAVEAAKAAATLDLGGFTKAEQATLAKLETNGYMGHRWKELDSYRLAIPGLEERDVSLTKRARLTRAMRRVRRIADYATRHMRYAERRNAVAMFNAMLKAGVSEDVAIARVAEITRRTQNPVTALEESELIDDIKTNPLAAAAWLFAGQGEIMANMIIEPIVRGDRKQAAKSAAFITVSLVALIGARELARFARRGFREEKDKRKQRDISDAVTQFLAESANLIVPGLGDWTNQAIRLAQHKPVNTNSIWQENLTGPLAKILPDVIDSIRDGKDPKWDRVIKNAIRLIDTATGLPGGNLYEYGESAVKAIRSR